MTAGSELRETELQEALDLSNDQRGRLHGQLQELERQLGARPTEEELHQVNQEIERLKQDVKAVVANLRLEQTDCAKARLELRKLRDRAVPTDANVPEVELVDRGPYPCGTLPLSVGDDRRIVDGCKERHILFEPTGLEDSRDAAFVVHACNAHKGLCDEVDMLRRERRDIDLWSAGCVDEKLRLEKKLAKQRRKCARIKMERNRARAEVGELVQANIEEAEQGSDEFECIQHCPTCCGMWRKKDCDECPHCAGLVAQSEAEALRGEVTRVRRDLFKMIEERDAAQEAATAAKEKIQEGHEGLTERMQEAEALAGSLKMQMDSRRLRGRDTVELLRACFKLRTDCNKVDDAAADACAEMRALREKIAEPAPANAPLDTHILKRAHRAEGQRDEYRRWVGNRPMHGQGHEWEAWWDRRPQGVDA